MSARGHARVIVDADPAMAIVRGAEEAGADLLVVGNVGMAGRREFLLGNVPNRVSHNARCSVLIVNTTTARGAPALLGRRAPDGCHGRSGHGESLSPPGRAALVAMM